MFLWIQIHLNCQSHQQELVRLRKKNRCMSQLLYRESKSKIKKKICSHFLINHSENCQTINNSKLVSMATQLFHESELYRYQNIDFFLISNCSYGNIYMIKYWPFGNRVFRAYDWVFVLTIEYKNLLMQKCNDA